MLHITTSQDRWLTHQEACVVEFCLGHFGH